MKHRMNLNDAPFRMIKSGEKTIELRLYDEKRRTVKVGDMIEFAVIGNPYECLTTQVTDLHVFKSFEELYHKLPLLKCGYTEQNIGTASPADMNIYYTENEQKKYGVVGIELRLIQSQETERLILRPCEETKCKEIATADITYISGSHKFNYRVCGIVTHDKKILAMHDERSPYYYLPGGRVKMGETAEQAILREIEEELGISARIIRPLWLNQGFFTEDVDKLNYHELCIYFLLDISGTGLQDRGNKFTLYERQHIHEFEWLPFDQLKNEYFYPIFLKTEISNLPENFTIRTEFE